MNFTKYAIKLGNKLNGKVRIIQHIKGKLMFYKLFNS